MSKLALDLIKENIEKYSNGEDASSLNLAYCNINRYFPEELFQCVWLEELILTEDVFDYELRQFIQMPENRGYQRNYFYGIPNEIGKLKNLQRLYLGGNYDRLNAHTLGITDITPIKNLSQLRILDVSTLPFNDISPLQELKYLHTISLQNLKLSDISPLKELKQLRRLYLTGNELEDISPIKDLEDLEELYLAKNQLQDISALSKLYKLKILYLGENYVSDLKPLEKLNQIIELDLGSNPVMDISSLQGMKKLNMLALGMSKVEDINPLSSLTNLKTIDLRLTDVKSLDPIIPLIKKNIPVIWSDNSQWNQITIYSDSIVSPPPEIIDQGNDAILNYFQDIDLGSEKNDRIKFILIGNTRAGKTCLRYCLKENYFPSKDELSSTHGIQVHVWEPIEENNTKLNVHLWDFGGQEFYHATHRMFLSNNAVYGLVWEADTNRQFIQETTFPIKLRDGSLGKRTVPLEYFPHTYWLKTIRAYAKESPILIIQNKYDKSGKKTMNWINVEELEGYNVKNEALYDLSFMLSFESDHSHRRKKQDYENFVEDLCELLRNNALEYQFPDYWQPIRDRIELEKGNRYLTLMEFHSLCRNELQKQEHLQNRVIDFDNLIVYLRDMASVILYYPDNEHLKDTVFIDPNWLNEHIYSILNYKVIDQDGLFSREEVLDLMEEEQANQMIALMQQFELIFPSPDVTNYFIAPQYLPDQMFDRRAKKIIEDKIESTKLWLVIRFKDFMPRHIMLRFLARSGHLAKEHLYWRTGIVFNLSGLNVYVRVSYEDQPKVYIEIEDSESTDFVGRIVLEAFQAIIDRDYAFELSRDGKAFISFVQLRSFITEKDRFSVSTWDGIDLKSFKWLFGEVDPVDLRKVAVEDGKNEIRIVYNFYGPVGSVNPDNRGVINLDINQRELEDD